MKVLKLNTIDKMHEQLELPTGKYGVVVEIVNVKSVYNPGEFPVALYKSLQAGPIEINSINYSDTTVVHALPASEQYIELFAYELDTTELLPMAGLQAIEGFTPYALVAVVDTDFIKRLKMDSITLVVVDDVLKGDIVVNPLAPIDGIAIDDPMFNIYRLSYIPYIDFINDNYLIYVAKNSLNTELAKYLLLSNRHDVTKVKTIDLEDDYPIAGVDGKTLIVIGEDGMITIDDMSWSPMDLIKAMCTKFNIQFTASDLMIECDAIINNLDGYQDVKRLLTNIINSDVQNEGFINNTINVVSNGGYKTFTTFFNGELVELNSRKRLARECLDKSQVAHSDSYTITIISSNILIDEIIVSICDRELENPSTEHVYAIISNHTEHTDLISICFNNTELLDMFEGNIAVDFGESIDIPMVLGLTANVSDVIKQNSKITNYSVKSYTLNPMYCN